MERVEGVSRERAMRLDEEEWAMNGVRLLMSFVDAV